MNAQKVAELLETARDNWDKDAKDEAFFALCDAVEEILVALDPRPPLIETPAADPLK